MTKLEIYKRIKKLNETIALNEPLTLKENPYQERQEAKKRINILVSKKRALGVELLGFESITARDERLELTLKEARERVYLDIRLVADIIGVHLDTVVQWEKGRKIQQRSNLAKLCRLYDVMRSELIL